MCIILYGRCNLGKFGEYVDAKERFRRLRICFIVLEILTVIFSATEKIMTYLCLSQLGGYEANAIPAMLIREIGLVPAIIIGFFASLIPIIVLNIGIKKLKLESEVHYWIWTVFMTFYMVLFYKVFEHNLLEYLAAI